MGSDPTSDLRSIGANRRELPWTAAWCMVEAFVGGCVGELGCFGG